MARSTWITAFAFAPLSFGIAQPSSESAAEAPITEIRNIDAADAVPTAEGACFRSSEIRDFDAPSDRFVLLETIRREIFLLTMFEGCFGLRSTVEIALLSDLDRVCSNSNASVRYRGSHGAHETCPIVGVESVEDKPSGRRIIELREGERHNR